MGFQPTVSNIANCNETKKVLQATRSSKQDAEKFLRKYEEEGEKYYYQSAWSRWKFYLHINDANQAVMEEAQMNQTNFDAIQANKALAFRPFSRFEYETRRRLEKISDIGLFFDDSQAQEFNRDVNQMSKIYSNAYVCNVVNPNCYNDPTATADHWEFDPTLANLMFESRDYDLLEYIWKQWRQETGMKELPYYRDYVKLGNEGAKKGNYSNMGEWWRSSYEDPDFETQLENLWAEVLPFYEELHSYIRRNLMEKIYPNRFNTTAIPAHILGNMWAQEWTALFKDTAPYPDLPSVDVTETMKQKKYTPLKMFETAQDFFNSIGLFNMTPEFWKYSMLEKPKNRSVDCWPTAEDFGNRKDFTIKMCTVVNMIDLVTVHHEMGHIEYYMSYMNQPLEFKEGANPGFHEAIGDTIALSVNTPNHLESIGLLQQTEEKDRKKQHLNFLYNMALSKIAFLPFGYLIDLYRWKIFSGSVPSDQWNTEWWKLRYKYQGLVPPVPRTNRDFDAGAKYHVPNDVPYIRYFVAAIIQFQFQKALCEAAGHKGALSDCDIYKSKAAGTKLKNMLSMGSSKPWQDAMEVIANTRKMSAQPMLEYFKEIRDWLHQRNSEAGDCYGWGYEWPASYNLPQPRCGKFVQPLPDYEEFIEQHNKLGEQIYYDFVNAEWTYWLNETSWNQEESVRQSAIKSAFDSAEAKKAKSYFICAIPNATIKREMSTIATVEIVLNETDMKRFYEDINNMNNIYSTAYICNPAHPDCHESDTGKMYRWEFNPTLSKLMATSTDYDLLKYIWVGWRNETGVKELPLYREYVQLGNKGARNAGYANMGSSWRSVYEDPEFTTQLEKLWAQVLPFYEELFAYMRHFLKSRYPGKFSTTALPAHILGNMWAQSWTNLFDATAPYRNLPSVDVTEEMKKQNYTPKLMFE
ncbi:unnamed protein product [Soboliphyme baturini]|uniref:Angiotensin-converting enzyme n=1 Tax=Soboliphyme baturini TaxID=241478 RepID=A0A183IW52_9BILA|nr:unnamed protein product [Soboliphyme baturini]